MSAIARALIVTLGVCASLSLSTDHAGAAELGSGEPPGISGWADGGSIALDGHEADPTTEPDNSDTPLGDVVYVRLDRALCNPELQALQQLSASCAEGDAAHYDPVSCPADSFQLAPLFRMSRDPATGEWSEPEPVEQARCISPADIAPDVATEFRRLPITPTPLAVQPPDGWTLVNLPTITYTDPPETSEQTFTTTILDIPITLIATPTTYTWNYDDGTPPTTTTDPGHPYPHHTITHTYTTPGTATITLTTTWTGRFHITTPTLNTTNTTTWTPITGTATTTSTAPPLDILETRTHLIDGLDR